MAEVLAGILAASVALAVILAILWPRTTFLIEIAGGEARLVQGKLSVRLVAEFSDAVAGDRDVRGEIRGIRQVGRFSIRFSKEIPEGTRQRFRNLWALYVK